MIEAIVGAAFGLIGGMGMGGGIVLIPALVLLGEAQHTAQGLCLLAFLPMSAGALYLHARAKRIALKLALILCAAGLPASLLFAYIASLIEGGLLRKIMGGALIIAGVIKLALALRKKHSRNLKS